jgi:GTP-binding protein
MKFNAEFICSALKMDDCPRWNRTEVALAGRSNVGKSSLLNGLARSKHLARTSKTPGRTRCVNFFAVEENLALVDLPGYGYAKLSHVEAAKIAKLMEDYLAKRENLSALVLLVDARRGPQQEETAIAELGRRREIGLIVAATKADKLRRSERLRAIKQFEMLGAEPIMCSALSGEGLDELRERILGCSAGDANHARPERKRFPPAPI